MLLGINFIIFVMPLVNSCFKLQFANPGDQIMSIVQIHKIYSGRLQWDTIFKISTPNITWKQLFELVMKQNHEITHVAWYDWAKYIEIMSCPISISQQPSRQKTFGAALIQSRINRIYWMRFLSVIVALRLKVATFVFQCVSQVATSMVGNNTHYCYFYLCLFSMSK